MYMGKNMGFSICRVARKFEITVLGVSKLQKTVPQNVEFPATLCQSIAEAYVSGRPKIIIKSSSDSHNSNLLIRVTYHIGRGLRTTGV